MKTHQLGHEEIHQEWNNALPPRLEVEPGDTVVFETRDAANRFYSKASTHDDVLRRGPFRGHPLTGPVTICGARPGDTLVIAGKGHETYQIVGTDVLPFDDREVARRLLSERAR